MNGEKKGEDATHVFSADQADIVLADPAEEAAPASA